MIKLVVFDLDNTLAPMYSPMKENTLASLKDLSKKVHLAVASGKTPFYLAGFFRQAGIKDIKLIGENGAVTYLNSDLPCEVIYARVSQKYLENREKIFSDIKKLLSNKICFQPNEIALSFFYKGKKDKEKIENYLKSQNYNDIDTYYFDKSVDICPKNVNKAYGINRLAKKMEIEPNGIIIVGDSENDISMAKFTPYSIGIGNLKENVRYNVKDINSALHLLNIMGDEIGWKL